MVSQCKDELEINKQLSKKTTTTTLNWICGHFASTASNKSSICSYCCFKSLERKQIGKCGLTAHDQLQEIVSLLSSVRCLMDVFPFFCFQKKRKCSNVCLLFLTANSKN